MRRVCLECVDCVGEGANTPTRFSMPLATLGEKKYYLGIFFKVNINKIFNTLSIYFPVQANWYKAEQYCRFHGMHLASINSEQEQRELEVRNIFLD